MAKRGEGKPTMESPIGKVGTYVAYDGSGNELWRRDEFEIGRDKVPSGIALAMKSMTIVDPATGDVISKWDPWRDRQSVGTAGSAEI